MPLMYYLVCVSKRPWVRRGLWLKHGTLLCSQYWVVIPEELWWRYWRWQPLFVVKSKRPFLLAIGVSAVLAVAIASCLLNGPSEWKPFRITSPMARRKAGSILGTRSGTWRWIVQSSEPATGLAAMCCINATRRILLVNRSIHTAYISRLWVSMGCWARVVFGTRFCYMVEGTKTCQRVCCRKRTRLGTPPDAHDSGQHDRLCYWRCFPGTAALRLSILSCWIGRNGRCDG